jgi:muramoyltetrapeptide carboxypeptidase
MHEGIVKPRALKPGDTIKIIAPSSITSAKLNLPKAVNFLTKSGFKVSLSSVMQRKSATRYFATAGDHVRLTEIEEAFKSDEIDGIMVLRGGSGAIDLLNMIDYQVIRDHPKVFIGYSDITFLQMAFLSKAGLVTFHGPMLIDLAEEDQNVIKYNFDTLMKIVSSQELMTLRNPADVKWSRTIVDGKAQGRLIGGDLSVLSIIANTPFMPKPDGDIVFMEDVDVEPWEVDNMLTSLVIKDFFSKASGIFFGEFPPYDLGEAAASVSRSAFVEDYLDTAIGDVIYDIVTKKMKEMPSFMDFLCCHGKYITTLPLGVRVEMDSKAREITMLESAVE